MEEVYPDPVLEMALQENHNKIEGLPLDTPLWNEDHYFGTIPPTFVEWISEPIIGRSPNGIGFGMYRIFKKTNGDYALQDKGCVDSVNVATGDLDFIVDLHKKLTHESPVFIQKQEAVT